MNYKTLSPKNHIIHTKQFTREYIDTLIDKTKRFKEKKESDCLNGKIFAILFYEPSTRTKFSFESAILKLGGKTIGTENASIFSSAYKNETIEDTIRMLNNYVDAVIIRHTEDTSSDKAIRVAEIPIINAGSGMAQHPTQTLLDMYTIYEKFGRLEGLSITIVGDLLRSRTVNSLLYLLSRFNNTFTFVSTENSKIADGMREFLEENNVSYTETDDLRNSLKDTDVCYMTRIQKERFTNEEEYTRMKGRFILNNDLAETMKDEAIILHPLPRVDELDVDVDDNKRAWYFKQAENGLYVRMALLSLLNYR